MSKMARRMLWLMLATAGLWIGGCGGKSHQADGGDGAADVGPNNCHVDNSTRTGSDTAWQLQPGQGDLKDWICPPGDIDYYWFKVDQPGTIVKVHLWNSVPISPVNYCYDLLLPDPQAPRLGGLCNANGLAGITDITGTHYLKDTGTYYLEVRDQTGGAQDPGQNAAYHVAISTVQDPDTYEPNNTWDQAKAVGSAPGYISYLGDQDWFKVDVNTEGQILTLDLITSAPTPVNLSYTVYRPDHTTPVNTGKNDQGNKNPTALHDSLALPEKGTYYVQIKDDLDANSDTTVGYTLQLSTRLNPDSRDTTPPFNNTWDTATAISSGQTVSGAYVASRADEDWYVIDSPGTTDTKPALIEVDLSVAGGSALDLAVDLIVADPNTPCSAGDKCDDLVWTCGGGGCQTGECRNAECPSHECHTQTSKCSGAGICVTNSAGSYHGCGIRNLIMHGADWSETGDAHHLHTVAPMYGDRYYLMVRDFTSSHYDASNPYTLTVTVHPELDTHEPNGVYQPYATNDSERDTKDWNKSLANHVTCTCAAAPGDCTCTPITGYLSYRGDQDWYVFDGIPTDETETGGAGGLKTDYQLIFDWSFQGSGSLDILYGWARGANFDQFFGWEHVGAGSGTFGTGSGECSYCCGEYQPDRPIYFVVQDKTRRHYDYSHPYTATLTVKRICPQNCQWCGTSTCDYACPTAANPCGH